MQTKPAITLISEEIAEKNMSLEQIVDHIVRIMAERRLKGINHGVILVPEGLIEFVPEMRQLISELNKALAEYETDIKDLPTFEDKRNSSIHIFRQGPRRLWPPCPRTSRRC